jgi:hypothetical protein
MLPEVVLNPEKCSGLFRFWNRFTVNFIWCRKPEVMGTMAKFSKYESLSASLFVPNIALFPTYLSFFTADRLSYFENLAIVPITSGLRHRILHLNVKLLYPNL